MDGVGLTQSHVDIHELLDGRAEGAEIALQDPGTVLVLGLKLRRHDGGVWRESETDGEKRGSLGGGKEDE